MTTVVFLVLAVVWVAVLFFWFRARRPMPDSVGLFHHHLRVIEQVAPATRAAANRLRGPSLTALRLRGVSRSPAAAIEQDVPVASTVGDADAAPFGAQLRLAEAGFDEYWVERSDEQGMEPSVEYTDEPSLEHWVEPSPEHWVEPPPAPRARRRERRREARSAEVARRARRRPVTVHSARRRGTQRRRRSLLSLLTLIVISTAVIDATRRGTDMAVVQGAADAVLVGYVALLARVGRLSARREAAQRRRQRRNVPLRLAPGWLAESTRQFPLSGGAAPADDRAEGYVEALDRSDEWDDGGDSSGGYRREPYRHGGSGGSRDVAMRQAVNS